jgi:ribonuclease D
MSGKEGASAKAPCSSSVHNGGGKRQQSRKSQKRHDYKKKTLQQQADNKQWNGGGFTAQETRILVQYLQEYCQGACEAHTNNKKAKNNHEKQQKNKESPSSSSLLLTMGQDDNDDDGTMILAGIPFPRLDNQVLSGPWLSFPKEVSPRQRKTIHTTCADLGLYHCAMGDEEQDRSMAISIYCDVFSSLSGFPTHHQRRSNNNNDNPYRPWICRQENRSSLYATQRIMRDKIQQLVDQPWQCLRDRDALDMEQLIDMDLSTMTVPPKGTDPQQKMSSSSSSSSSTTWILIDTPDKMKQCIRELTSMTEKGQEEKVTELGFDLEAFNPHPYCQRTCLLQLTSNLGKEYIIDTLAEGVWDTIHGLAPLFRDPTIVKVGHSMGGLDVQCLFRDFGITIVNAFDTYEAAKVLKLPSHGLAAVCQYYGMPMETTTEYVSLKDHHQTMDWRKRPLTSSMILYGRYDVHYLLALRKLMMRDLVLLSTDNNTMSFDATSYIGALQQMEDMEDQLYEEWIAQGNDTNDHDNNKANANYNLAAKNDDSHHPVTTDTTNGVDTTNGYHKDVIMMREGVHAMEAIEHRQGPITPDNGGDPDENDDYDYSNDDKGDESNVTGLVTVDKLRMQAQLMTTITESQYRCRGMAKAALEFHFKNDLFVTLLRGGREKKQQARYNNKKGQKKKQRHLPGQQQQHTPCTKSQIVLFEQLVQFRLRLADSRECLPGFVCSLEELVLLCAGRPTNVDALRIIDYHLPERLGVAATRHILDLTRQSLQRDRVTTSHFDDKALRKYYQRPASCWSMTDKLLLGSLAVSGLGMVISLVARRRWR